MATSYTNLESGFTSALSPRPLTFDATGAINTFATFDFMYVASITLIIGAAAIMYVVAGAWRVEASERGMKKSNETFKRVTLGLIGVLSMFTVLYTVNRDLLRGDLGLSRLSSITTGAGTAGVVPATTQTLPAANGSEQANRAALAAAGISVNKSACTADQMKETAPSCTNLTDMPQAVISMLIQLKDSCPGSSITVTGGTEPGHKTHGPGRFAVDVRIGDSPLDSCIRKYPKGPYNSSNSQRFQASYLALGFVFGDEIGGDPHWHIFK